MGGCCKQPGRRKQIGRKQNSGTQNKADDQLANSVITLDRYTAVDPTLCCVYDPFGRDIHQSRAVVVERV